MDRYVGLDVHASSCTAAVVGPSGRHLRSQVLETNASSLIEFLKTLPRPRHLCVEEGTHAGWLHEVLLPHVEELVVAGVDHSRGPKSDKRDAFGLAEALRVGAIKTRVYKGLGEFRQLRELRSRSAGSRSPSAPTRGPGAPSCSSSPTSWRSWPSARRPSTSPASSSRAEFGSSRISRAASARPASACSRWRPC